jgi:hypothetical protein
MLHIRKFNESVDEVEIVNFLEDIFLELKDTNININVLVNPIHDIRAYLIPNKTKIIGFDIKIISKENIKLSDIYDNVLMCMDYMRSNNMFLRSFNSWQGDLKKDINYFYDYMAGVEKDISSELFSIRFKS